MHEDEDDAVFPLSQHEVGTDGAPLPAPGAGKHFTPGLPHPPSPWAGRGWHTRPASLAPGKPAQASLGQELCTGGPAAQPDLQEA